jgi:hypothetical protein
MAEERQRGSLDLLVATTLSTRAIVIGKWLGTFRLVAPMTIGLGLIALAMATAHSNSSLAFGPGLPPEYYRRISLGTRCYGAAVAIATILAHGALITSVGLALAVWIKRQSRAIALTVGWFILVTAAWPIVVSIVMSGDPNRGENLVALSPVAVCINLIPLLTQRTYAFMNGTLRSGTFWAVEVSGAALAILWLTIRTFDGCFDRIPDRPWQISHRTAGIKILAAIVAAGCLVGAVDCWIEGVEVGFNGPSYETVLAFCLVLAIALVLVGAETARTGTMKQTEIRDANPTLAIREFVLSRWWTSFQLVLLLAIGPTLLALALATAHRTPHYSPQFTKNAAGVDVVTSFVLERTDQPYAGEVRLGQRLAAAAVLIATIMVHGGAAISVGMAFAVVSGWSRRTIAAGVVLAVLVALVLPVCMLLLNYRRPPIDGGWSFALATSSLLIALLTRTSFILGETIVSVTAWDIATALFAIALCSWTVWSWQRRLRNAPRAEPAHPFAHNECRPAVESGLVGE